ncbi:MAG: hypothetical protein II910_08945 [Prevotella sp.]|nr:hypothetical protein [Prevotella sp.]
MVSINKRKSDGSALMYIMCALVFLGFTFCYLYFYQADILAVMQHILSGGKTHYNTLIGAVLITGTLWIVQLVVLSITRLTKRFHALTYLPSLLCLLMLTAINTDVENGLRMRHWLWIAPIVLVLFGVGVWMIRQQQAFERMRPGLGMFSQLMWNNLLILTAMCGLVALIGNSNDVLHYRLRMERDLMKGDVAHALTVGDHARATDANLMMLRAYALAKNNQLGERFFTYSQQSGVKSLLPNGNSQQTLILPAVEIQRYAASKGADDYRLVHYLLVRDLKTFARSVIKCYDVKNGTLPRHYQEALVLYHHRFSDPAVSYENAVLDADYEDMQKLMRQYTDPKMKAAKVRDVYGNTYWYYYFFVK